MAGAVVYHARVPSNIEKAASFPVPYPSSAGVYVCWWDSHEFEGVPVGCPVRHDENRGRFWCEGFFCSWSCVRAYAGVYVKDLVTRNMIPLWIKKLSGDRSRNGISAPAPHWCVLARFGGNMSIEEFRENAGGKIHVVPHRDNVCLLGHDVFIEEPQIRIPSFSEYRMRRVNTPSGYYEFPKLKAHPMCQTKRSHHSMATQTGQDDCAPTKVKKAKVVRKDNAAKADLMKLPGRKSSVLLERQNASSYKRAKTAANQYARDGLQGLLRPKSIFNPLISCMNIKVLPKSH